MPSQLRYSSSPVTIKTAASFESSPLQPPQKKQKMTLTQTYYLAHTARAKLSKEAARADHDLRLLVGHANLLDGLMLDLAEAEREQESWFHQTVKGASKASEEPKHIQWADSLPDVSEEEDDDESWDGSDVDEDEISATLSVPLRIAPSPPMTVTTTEVDMVSDEEDADYEEFEEELALTRVSSRSSSRTPPELLDESDSSDSDEDSMPLSPPQSEIPLDAFSQQQRESIATTSYFKKSTSIHTTSIASPPSEEGAFYEDGFYLPQRQEVTVY